MIVMIVYCVLTPFSAIFQLYHGDQYVGLYNQAKKTKKWNNYRQCQKECKKQMRKAEWDYINSTINEGLQNNNSKPFWKNIKSKKQDNIGVSPLKQGVQLVTNRKEKAEILIRQFQSVFTKDTSVNMPKHPQSK